MQRVDVLFEVIEPCLLTVPVLETCLFVVKKPPRKLF